MPLLIIFHPTAGIVMGYGLDNQGSIPGGEEIFLYSTASGPALGLT
jgi:hypothetical protein